MCLQKSHGIPKAPITVAVGIPKETIARRPDIYQARLEAIAQSATIGATQSQSLSRSFFNRHFCFSSNNIRHNLN